MCIGDADYPYVVFDFTADYTADGPETLPGGLQGLPPGRRAGPVRGAVRRRARSSTSAAGRTPAASSWRPRTAAARAQLRTVRRACAAAAGGPGRAELRRGLRRADDAGGKTTPLRGDRRRCGATPTRQTPASAMATWDATPRLDRAGLGGPEQPAAHPGRHQAGEEPRRTSPRRSTTSPAAGAGAGARSGGWPGRGPGPRC